MTDRKFQRYENCMQQHPYEHFLAKAISRNASWRLIIKIDSFQTKKREIYWMRMLKTIISFISFYYILLRLFSSRLILDLGYDIRFYFDFCFCKEVYRGIPSTKKSYCKRLIVLFIWLIAFYRRLQLFYEKSHRHNSFKFFTKNSPYFL